MRKTYKNGFLKNNDKSLFYSSDDTFTFIQTTTYLENQTSNKH
jgi:hypothetical protein